MLCPRCQAAIAARARFCAQCGTTLPAAAPSRAERRQLTVLFCDLVDSTALSTLVQAMKRARQHQGDCRLCEVQQPVRIILELTRLDKAFEIYSDEAAAARSFAN